MTGAWEIGKKCYESLFMVNDAHRVNRRVTLAADEWIVGLEEGPNNLQMRTVNDAYHTRHLSNLNCNIKPTSHAVS